MCLDKLCEEENIVINKKYKDVLFTETQISGSDVILVKPMTFMNESGRAVSFIKKSYELDNNDFIIVYDDIDIPISEIKIKERGNAGTHKGLKSVLNHLGSNDVPRIKIGINNPNYKVRNMVKYVLTPLKGKYLEELLIGVYKAKDSIMEIIKNGLANAMNKYNRRINLLASDTEAE